MCSASEAPWQALADDEADPQAQRRPDLVQRDFRAARPNELWVADLALWGAKTQPTLPETTNLQG